MTDGAAGADRPPLTRRRVLAAAGAWVVGAAGAGWGVASAGRAVVALTFDDGPDPDYTPAVLDALARFAVPATFFAVGANVGAHPSLARRIASEGHTLGNHTFHHRRLDSLDPDQVAAELDGTADALVQAGVAPGGLFRAPYGVTTAVVDGAVRSRGYRLVGWDACLERCLRGVGPQEGVGRLLAGIRPGAVILAHDGGRLRSPHEPTIRRDASVEALPLFLEALARRGWKVGDLAAVSGEMDRVGQTGTEWAASPDGRLRGGRNGTAATG